MDVSLMMVRGLDHLVGEIYEDKLSQVPRHGLHYLGEGTQCNIQTKQEDLP